MGFVIARDARGSLVHVRTEDGECVGCIEVGLYEIVRAVIVEEVERDRRAGEGSPAADSPSEIEREEWRFGSLRG